LKTKTFYPEGTADRACSQLEVTESNEANMPDQMPKLAAQSGN